MLPAALSHIDCFTAINPIRISIIPNATNHNNDDTDSITFSSEAIDKEEIDDSQSTYSEFVDLRSDFVKYYYYEPLRDDPDDILKFFEECPIVEGVWSKSSPEHYFMNQLQLNRNGNRVWNCSRAQILVIPISLGNWHRNKCGVDVKNEIVGGVQLMKRINKKIFENPSSCWNVAPETRPFHMVMVGGSAGRSLLRKLYRAKPMYWRGTGDEIKYSLNPNERVRQWLEYKLIFADSWSDSWLRSRGKSVVMVSTGFTSLASKSVSMTNQILNERLSSRLSSKELPEITIHHNFEEWKQRKFNLFLMGQADDREAYSLRRMALRQLAAQNNVLIQTGSSDTFRLSDCRRDRNGVDIDFFPCAMTASSREYIHYLAQSQFNLMFGGDDPCSSRFYDGLAFNAINIVISDGFDGCLIGRSLMTEQQRNMLYLTVKEEDFRAHSTESIYREINKFNDSDFERMLEEIEKWKPYLLWDSYRSETAETVLLEGYRKAVKEFDPNFTQNDWKKVENTASVLQRKKSKKRFSSLIQHRVTKFVNTFNESVVVQEILKIDDE